MATARFIRSLKKGQILRATVEEVHSATETLCNFQGQLLLVHNRTGKKWQKGDPISLQVLSEHPLQFQVYDPSQTKFQRVV